MTRATIVGGAFAIVLVLLALGDRIGIDKPDDTEGAPDMVVLQDQSGT